MIWLIEPIKIISYKVKEINDGKNKNQHIRDRSESSVQRRDVLTSDMWGKHIFTSREEHHL